MEFFCVSTQFLLFGAFSYAVTGSLARLINGRVALRSDLIDRLFPSSGAQIEPTVKPGEKPPKNIPRLEGGPDDLPKPLRSSDSRRLILIRFVPACSQRGGNSTLT